MIAKVRDYIHLLKEAIAEAKAAGLGAAADELGSTVFAAFTTSSEMFQEHGLGIRRFLKETRGGFAAADQGKTGTMFG